MKILYGLRTSYKNKKPNLTFFGCKIGCKFCNSLKIRRYCGERGIRTPGASQHGGFQDRCNRPLYHLSERYKNGFWSKSECKGSKKS